MIYKWSMKLAYEVSHTLIWDYSPFLPKRHGAAWAHHLPGIASATPRLPNECNSCRSGQTSCGHLWAETLLGIIDYSPFTWYFNLFHPMLRAPFITGGRSQTWNETPSIPKYCKGLPITGRIYLWMIQDWLSHVGFSFILGDPTWSNSQWNHWESSMTWGNTSCAVSTPTCGTDTEDAAQAQWVTIHFHGVSPSCNLMASPLSPLHRMTFQA